MKFKFDLVEVGLCTVTLVVAAGYIADRVESPFGSLFGSRSESALESSSESASATPLVASAPPVPGAVGTGQGPLPDVAELLSSLADVPAPTLSGVASLGECGSDLSADGLDAMLNGTPAGFSGSDYPHAYPLGEGRLLWLFQDVFHGGGDTLSEATFAHNDGFVQTGDCVRLLGAGQNAGQNAGENGVRNPDGSAGPPQSLIGGELERRRERWFWPLDGEIGADGDLWVFVAEMENPDGTGASSGALPVATWLAVFDSDTLDLVSFDRAPDDSASLYGWSVVSDDDHSYLYGHCYRQFLPQERGGLLGTDPSCSPSMYLARVPRGAFDAEPEYFTSAGWGPDPSAAVPVSMRAGLVNAASVERFGDTYVSITKPDDWFGNELVVSMAAAPEGPWVDVSTMPLTTRCAECNTYGTFLMPWTENGAFVVAVSNNSFEMQRDAFADATIYRPSIVAVPMGV